MSDVQKGFYEDRISDKESKFTLLSSIAVVVLLLMVIGLISYGLFIKPNSPTASIIPVPTPEIEAKKETTSISPSHTEEINIVTKRYVINGKTFEIRHPDTHTIQVVKRETR